MRIPWKNYYQRTWTEAEIRALPEWQYVMAVAADAGWPEIVVPQQAGTGGSHPPPLPGIILWPGGPSLDWREAEMFLEGFRYGRDLGGMAFPRPPQLSGRQP